MTDVPAWYNAYWDDAEDEHDTKDGGTDNIAITRKQSQTPSST